MTVHDTVDLLDPQRHASGTIDAVLDDIRSAAPVSWRRGRRGPGYWAITGYPELVAISRDPVRFSSWWGTRPEVRRTATAARPLHNLDPPDHTTLRRIATSFVSRERLDLVDEAARRGASEMVAQLRSGDDLVARFAVPVVSRTFARWLGLVDDGEPPASVDIALHLHHRVEAVHRAGASLLEAIHDPAHVELARDASSALASWLHDSMTTARAGTVLGELRTLVERGELTDVAAVALAVLLVEAGLPTAIDALLGAFERHASRPANLDDAIDDSLAARPPIVQFARYATCDVTIGAAEIRADQQVVLFYGAANRDPRRGDAPHVSYGAGPHRCIGAAFAHRVLRAALAVWYAHVPHHRTVATRRASSYQRGPSRLICHFE